MYRPRPPSYLARLAPPVRQVYLVIAELKEILESPVAIPSSLCRHLRQTNRNNPSPDSLSTFVDSESGAFKAARVKKFHYVRSRTELHFPSDLSSLHRG